MEGCYRTHQAKGYCDMHYKRMWKRGTLESRYQDRKGKVCSVDSCERTVLARLLCSGHYGRWLKTGEPGPAFQARPDGRITDKGYREVTRDGRKILEHRYVMEQHLGRPLRREETVHHIHGDRLDNRIESLELWSSSHPAGQRVADKVAWAKEMLALYEPSALSEDGDRHAEG